MGDNYYTIEELAKLFGVSITSINKWVKDGRFQGVKRLGHNKQLRITENTFWKDSRGNCIPIKTIVREYELQKKKDEKFTDEDELKALFNIIKHFEHKYNGTYEETLKIKVDKSPLEIRDEDEWVYLLERVKWE
jgi:excisionase family DNA binding protein